MQDRVPTKVLENGAIRYEDFDANGNSLGYRWTKRADEPTQEGTPLNKGNLLSDVTAGLFGLGSDAVPDGVLEFLGKYNQYWWKRRTTSYTEVRTADTNILLATYWSGQGSPQTSDSISINQSTGSVSLAAPITTLTMDTCSQTKGKYAYNGSLSSGLKTIHFINADATITYGSDGGQGAYFASAGYAITSLLTMGEWEYIQSSSRNTYPDSGVSNGYEYVYVGIPFNNAVEALTAETGTYVGTGAYGSSTPNSLTFSRIPKIVLITDGSSKYELVFFGITSEAVLINSNYTTSFSYSEKQMSWYCSNTQNAEAQLNVSGATYYYFAIC